MDRKEDCEGRAHVQKAIIPWKVDGDQPSLVGLGQ